MFLPFGSASCDFQVFRAVAVTTEMGRVLHNVSEEIGKISGVLAEASSYEKERWRQLSYPVSHKVILSGHPSFLLEVGDVLRWESGTGTREMILNGIPYDVGNLGHYLIIYGNERRDLS